MIKKKLFNKGGLTEEQQRVKSVQEKLINAGIPVKADGIWGKETERAWNQFKKKTGKIDNIEARSILDSTYSKPLQRPSVVNKQKTNIAPVVKQTKQQVVKPVEEKIEAKKKLVNKKPLNNKTKPVSKKVCMPKVDGTYDCTAYVLDQYAGITNRNWEEVRELVKTPDLDQYYGINAWNLAGDKGVIARKGGIDVSNKPSELRRGDFIFLENPKSKYKEVALDKTNPYLDNVLDTHIAILDAEDNDNYIVKHKVGKKEYLEKIPKEQLKTGYKIGNMTVTKIQRLEKDKKIPGKNLQGLTKEEFLTFRKDDKSDYNLNDYNKYVLDFINRDVVSNYLEMGYSREDSLKLAKILFANIMAETKGDQEAWEKMGGIPIPYTINQAAITHGKNPSVGISQVRPNSLEKDSREYKQYLNWLESKKNRGYVEEEENVVEEKPIDDLTLKLELAGKGIEAAKKNMLYASLVLAQKYNKAKQQGYKENEIPNRLFSAYRGAEGLDDYDSKRMNIYRRIYNQQELDEFAKEHPEKATLPTFNINKMKLEYGKGGKTPKKGTAPASVQMYEDYENRDKGVFENSLKMDGLRNQVYPMAMKGMKFRELYREYKKGGKMPCYSCGGKMKFENGGEIPPTDEYDPIYDKSIPKSLIIPRYRGVKYAIKKGRDEGVPFVNRMIPNSLDYNKRIFDEQGNPMTHRLEEASVGKYNAVYPTVDFEDYKFQSGNLREYDSEDAFNLARENRNMLLFRNKNTAKRFAEGAWKKKTNPYGYQGKQFKNGGVIGIENQTEKALIQDHSKYNQSTEEDINKLVSLLRKKQQSEEEIKKGFKKRVLSKKKVKGEMKTDGMEYSLFIA